MKLICPCKNLFSKKINPHLNKMFKCNFSNLNQKNLTKYFIIMNNFTKIFTQT